LTTIALSESDRAQGKTMQTELGTVPNLLQFTSQQGAEVVLNAALLKQDEVHIGEFVLPYFYGFASLVSSAYHHWIPHSIRVVVTISYEHLFQKMTYQHGRVWVCPASIESRSTTLQQQVRDLYWNQISA
jgi:hypothetical protein